MSNDLQHMMEWLTSETVQGLAFNTGSTFDPPNELRPWHIQPDISMGLGWVPLNKGKFPQIATPALADLDPASMFPGKVMFPNIILHLRMGLPRRWDFSLRGNDMTVPKGYRISNATRGDGQSNSLGFTLRKHFLGGDLPLLSLAGNYNHVFGRFNLYNEYKQMELTPGFRVDSVNTGVLQWNVNSIGANAVASQKFGRWTPFVGLGYNRMSGSVRGRLEARFDDPLILPSVGEASDRPEENQGRLIFGAQMDRSWISFFVNGEMKAVGYQAGRTFSFTTGFVAPFSIGARGFVKNKDAKKSVLAFDPRDGNASDARRAAAPPGRGAVRSKTRLPRGDSLFQTSSTDRLSQEVIRLDVSSGAQQRVQRSRFNARELPEMTLIR